jgi:cytoskeleton protein RodZ
MSEPQQQQENEGTQTSVGLSGSVGAGGNGAPRSAQATGPAFFDTLAAAGMRLAQLREAKGWSIDDVSARLKVPVPKMRALEAGDISQLPGTTFALGVVRSYAKMLGVDPAPFAQALRRDKGEPEPDLSMPASTGTDLPRGRVSVSLGGTPRHRSWWWGVAAVIVALIALVMWRSGGESPAWLARLKASANGSAVGSGEASATAAQGQTVASGTAIVADSGASDANTAGEPGGGQLAAGANAASTSAGGAAATASQAEAAVPGVSTPSASASSIATMPEASAVTSPAKAAAAAPSSSAAQSPQAVATNEASGATVAPGVSTVAFTVTQDSWFSVRDKSGKELFSGIVHAGDTKEIQGEEPFKVVAGNRAGVQSVMLDGKQVDAAKYGTGKGNVSRFSLP